MDHPGKFLVALCDWPSGRLKPPLGFALVDNEFSPRTRNTSRALGPGAWWTVEDVALSPALGLTYRLDRREGRPADRRDGHGRTVLEAFASLPMEQMSERLEKYRGALRGRADSVWEQELALGAISEMVGFVRDFGPVGVGWGAEFGIHNPEADRLERELEQARFTALGFDPAAAGGLADPDEPRFWTVSFWGHGPGRGAIPSAIRHTTYPKLAWAERIRLDDPGLPHDYWLQIVDEYVALGRTLSLVEAIARADPFACRKAMRAFARNDDVIWRLSDRAPKGFDRASAFRANRAGTEVKPFRLPEHEVDWVLLASFVLADLISRQIDFAMPLVAVRSRAQLEVRPQGTSLLEMVYLELLDHVQHRPDFGVGQCRACGGPILRTRRPGLTGNGWHKGCSRSARVLAWRRNHPGWGKDKRPSTGRRAWVGTPAAAPSLARSPSSGSGPCLNAEPDPNRP
jgi:hypothetical protein